MDGDEDHLSDTQISETHTNNILLTESEIEEIFNVLQPKSYKRDRKRKREDHESPPFQKRETVIVRIEAGRRLSGKSL